MVYYICRGEMNMTIKELYDWAVKNNAENFEVEYYDTDWGYLSIEENKLFLEDNKVLVEW